ncbi:MAG: DinB family protein [Nakamurella sp.]
MSIDPPLPAPADDKDWTWVLQRPCPDCGFDASALAGPDIGRQIRAAAQQWQQVLAGPNVRRRPASTVWSAAEYASHCRDVCSIFGDRLELMLEQDDPLFPNWDQDQTAIEKRYWADDPAETAAGMAATAGAAAASFDAVTDEQWLRTGRRSNGSVFTVETLGRYFVHDLVHHLWDVRAIGITPASAARQ